MVAVFPKLCLWRRSLCSNLGGIGPEKLYRATLNPIFLPYSRGKYNHNVLHSQLTFKAVLKGRNKADYLVTNIIKAKFLSAFTELVIGWHILSLYTGYMENCTGKFVRKIISACVVHEIRKTFPYLWNNLSDNLRLRLRLSCFKKHRRDFYKNKTRSSH